MAKLYKPRGDGPKALLLDIETSPNIVFAWGLFDQNIGLEQIKQDTNIISWSAKWLGSPDDEIMYQDQRNAKDVHNDKALLKDLWTLLDQADVVIGHNSDRFDLPRINARFIVNGYKKPSQYKKRDTLKIAKKYFSFTSNKLAYLCKILKVKNKKSEHKKFAGMALWTECLNGNKAAWKEMELYNKQDVLTLEDVFNKLKLWDNSLNSNLYHNRNEFVCECGGTKFHRNGYAYTTSGMFQRWKCVSCNSEMRDNKNLFSKEKRESLRRKIT